MCHVQDKIYKSKPLLVKVRPLHIYDFSYKFKKDVNVYNYCEIIFWIHTSIIDTLDLI